jgi:hypothetical protein
MRVHLVASEEYPKLGHLYAQVAKLDNMLITLTTHVNPVRLASSRMLCRMDVVFVVKGKLGILKQAPVTIAELDSTKITKAIPACPVGLAPIRLHSRTRV